jgi:hypothetical protein
MFNIKHNLIIRIFNAQVQKQMILVLFCILNICCFDRQEHGITEPPIPVYTLHGTIRDMDSHEYLAGVEVYIHNHSIDRDYEIIALDTTDSEGRYEFTEIISPGWNDFIIRRDGYKIYEETLNTWYSDREYDVDLPKLLLSNRSLEAPYGRVGGICWKNSTTLSILDTWETVVEGLTARFQRIYERNMLTGNDHLVSASTFLEQMYYLGLAYDGANYWCFGGKNLCQLNSTTMEIRTTFDMEAGAGIDLTRYENTLYLTKYNQILKVIQFSPLKFEVYDLALQALGGVAHDGNKFWVTDTYHNFVYQLDDQFEVLNTFMAFEKGSYDNSLYAMRYIVFDFEGKLWIAQRANIFCFTIPNVN